MTEDQAKEKWCPMVRAPMSKVPMEDPRDIATASINRSMLRAGGADIHGALCIASDCMMWRIYGNATKEGYCGIGGERAQWL